MPCRSPRVVRRRRPGRDPPEPRAPALRARRQAGRTPAVEQGGDPVAHTPAPHPLSDLGDRSADGCAVVPEDRYRALVGSDQAEEDAEQGGFSCSVGSDEPVDLSRSHHEIHTFDRVYITEGLAEADDLDRGFIRHELRPEVGGGHVSTGTPRARRSRCVVIRPSQPCNEPLLHSPAMVANDPHPRPISRRRFLERSAMAVAGGVLFSCTGGSAIPRVSPASSPAMTLDARWPAETL